MKTHSRPVLASVIISLAAWSAACSDQGAVKPAQVKSEAPAAAPASAGATAQAPPLVSPHGDGAPTAAPGGLPPVPEGAGVGDTALTWKVPEGWVSEKPASSMRRAQYKVPGAAGDGECVVFYFGPGQGGDPMSNAQRWAGQFTKADGSPAESAMKTSEIEVGGRKVIVVEVAGTYNGGMTMTMTPAVPKPGYRLLGAVAPGPDANWYFKFTGPDGTVNGARDAFLGMIRSMKHGAS